MTRDSLTLQSLCNEWRTAEPRRLAVTRVLKVVAWICAGLAVAGARW